MKKPEIGMTNLKLFIKNKAGFLVAGWTANKGEELHGDYVFVKDRKEGEKLLNDLKKSEGKDNVGDVVAISKKKLIDYGARNVSKE